MKRNLIVSLFAILALFAAAVPVGGAALAQSQNAPRVPVTKSTSKNWSGYAVQYPDLKSPDTGVVTDVQGSWTVPNVTGSGGKITYSSVWVGIDGYSSNSVEQIGTEQDYIGSGNAQYYAWYEMYPQRSYTINKPVSPGDVMTAEVSYSSGNFVLTLNDLTAVWSFTHTEAATADRSSAEWIVEAPSMVNHILPLANFGTVTFNGARATIGGHTGTISDSQWANDPITMIDGKATATPSALFNSGGSFTVTYSSSSGGTGPGGKHGKP